VLVDAVIPARNEADTIVLNVDAARASRLVRDVIVVDDGSTDDTAGRAEAAGARVLRRTGSPGSKAHAMRAGVDASDADAILFVDADCTGLTSAHLDEIIEPVVDGRAALSLGTFDYGPVLNPIVRRFPPLTGERCVPRELFDAIAPEKLDGYTIEIRINEVVCERRLPVVLRTMDGVFHRTKRDKFGRIEGVKRTLGMFRDLARQLQPFGDIRLRTYWFYLRNLTVDT
jgi:glycosyltransferase involved in cell wall biosynthesis